MRPSSILVCLLSLNACVGNPGIGGPDTTSTSTTSTTTTSSDTTLPTTTFDVLCIPGEQRCASDDVKEVCAPTGLAWQEEACNHHQTCTQQGNSPEAACIGPCETLAGTSLGCEFLAIRMRSENGTKDPADADAVVVGNTDTSISVAVRLLFTPKNFNQESQQGATVTLAPGESHVFKLTEQPMLDISSYREGGVYHVVSDYPISAYLHSPLADSDSNDASLLLPVKALGTDYVVSSYAPRVEPGNEADDNGRPSYFIVIATENDTEIDFTPRARTYGNKLNIDPVEPYQTGHIELQRLDTIQIGAASKDAEGIDLGDFIEQDVSGTVIRANKPIVVFGATSCANVPFTATNSCNHLQEQLLPVKYWGTRYVAAHSPVRGNERHYWRVYAGAPNQTVIINPSFGQGSLQFKEVGEYAEISFATGVTTVFKSNKPFMPVQYLAGGQEVGTPAFGDPSMVQAIPIEQHLERYVFVTGANYEQNFVQVIRQYDGPDVFINGTAVDDSLWYSVNSSGSPVVHVDIADVPLGPSDEPGVYLAESDGAFGINVIGYDTKSAYAYPGGMALEVINPEGGG